MTKQPTLINEDELYPATFDYLKDKYPQTFREAHRLAKITVSYLKFPDHQSYLLAVDMFVRGYLAQHIEIIR